MGNGRSRQIRGNKSIPCFGTSDYCQVPHALTILCATEGITRQTILDKWDGLTGAGKPLDMVMSVLHSTAFALHPSVPSSTCVGAQVAASPTVSIPLAWDDL